MRKLFKFLIFFLTFNTSYSFAQNLNLIRDAEIENFLNEVAKPIINSTKLKNKKVNFYLDKKKYVNAFVTNGQNIFVTTELLVKTNTIDEIAGVLAHEIGHITGGHLNKIVNASQGSFVTSLLSSILAASAFVAGAPDAGNAILLGGQHISSRQFLKFSRDQESYADQAAIKYMKASNYSVKGIYDLFKLLEKKERMSKFNPYNLTHPLSSERKKFVEFHINNEEKIKRPKLDMKFQLIQAKLVGFLSTPEITNIVYPEDENKVFNWYANSIKFYKLGQITKSIIFIDKCIKFDKENPYFYELKGQILYENSKPNESILNFEKALKFKKKEKHFQLALAKAIYSSGEKKKYYKSLKLLDSYIESEDFPVEAWHFKALCHGKLGQYTLSSIALIEKFLLLNDLKNAKLQLEKVILTKNIDKENIGKIEDLKLIIYEKEKYEKNNNN
tara:strand:+ start:900 stop:2234 length:1335 start_codon:yes stop_codon:yes gene_type:complete